MSILNGRRECFRSLRQFVTFERIGDLILVMITKTIAAAKLERPSVNRWPRSSIGRGAAIPLRLIVGFGFMEHGYAKVTNGPEHFIAILHNLGVPAPHLMGWLTILVELFGGFAVLIGAFVPLISIPLATILLVAMVKVHFAYGFSSIKLRAVTATGPQFGPPGYEVDLLYLACLSALVLGGAGPFTVTDALTKLLKQSPKLL